MLLAKVSSERDQKKTLTIFFFVEIKPSASYILATDPIGINTPSGLSGVGEQLLIPMYSLH